MKSLNYSSIISASAFVGFVLPAVAFASGAPSANLQGPAADRGETNVISIQTMPRLQGVVVRNGDNVEYVDVYRCPRETGYRCRVEPRK